MKIDQVEEGCAVIQANLVGLALAGAGEVFLDLGGEGDDLPVRCLGDTGGLAAINQAGGQLEQHILHPPARRFRQQRGQSRADTGQNDHVLEQGKENLGSHCFALYRQVLHLPLVDAASFADYIRHHDRNT